MNKFLLSALVAFCLALSLQAVVSYEPLETAAYEADQSDDFAALKDAADTNADEGFEDELRDYEDEIDNDEDGEEVDNDEDEDEVVDNDEDEEDEENPNGSSDVQADPVSFFRKIKVSRRKFPRIPRRKFPSIPRRKFPRLPRRKFPRVPRRKFPRLPRRKFPRVPRPRIRKFRLSGKKY